MANGNNKIVPVIHWERAYEVFDQLVDAVKQNAYPYNQIRPVYSVETVPDLPRGGVEEARFLMAVCCYMRGNVQSNTAIVALGNIYRDYPHLFGVGASLVDPVGVSNLLHRVLTEKGMTRIPEIQRQWTNNFDKLDRYWDGDPLNLFAELNYDAICHNLICEPLGNFEPDNPYGFRGFRQKMVSMLSFFLVRAGLVKPFSTPIPIDFHALRIILACELITLPDAPADYDLFSPVVEAACRELTQKYCDDRDVDSTILCDGTWFLSRTLCRHHPGNRSIVQSTADYETVSVTPYPYTWTEHYTRLYQQTCGRCPIEGSCKWLVPASLHYKLGKLRCRSLRDTPPQQTFLFFPDE